MTAEQRDPRSSEMRYDWLADRWVIMAPNRTRRPNDFRCPPPTASDSQSCPFCAGHEAETPPALSVYGAGDDADTPWLVRVVPNKFPAVNGKSYVWPASDSAIPKSSPCSIDLYHRRELAGGHEVIVESPHHFSSLSQLSDQETALVFTAYRDRLRYWLQDRLISYAVVFKNSGLDAGASLAHIHSQLIATDTVPADVFRLNQRMHQFLEQEGECVFCRMVHTELEAEMRIVEATEDWLAFCPFASRLPGSVTILPRDHQTCFEQIDDRAVASLARFMRRLVQRIEHCYPQAAYNYVIHTAPGGSRESTAFHWRIEMFPRLTKVAGFEWGSECYINPILPEHAAACYRQVGGKHSHHLQMHLPSVTPRRRAAER
ncbi:MAG: galactose-1-phosphate uridylyltransferase [Pirellulaceae bacterium]|nr:MAG: galactose-1-phosphate uridylyltransferase [Pirellulaceae bacterium]